MLDSTDFTFRNGKMSTYRSGNKARYTHDEKIEIEKQYQKLFYRSVARSLALWIPFLFLSLVIMSVFWFALLWAVL